MLTIDGSSGEGGGQILRTALALSTVTGKPFRIEKIRAGRPKPGLLRQHLTAVKAAATISGAAVGGAELGAGAVTFTPGSITPGEFAFAVGEGGFARLLAVQRDEVRPARVRTQLARRHPSASCRRREAEPRQRCRACVPHRRPPHVRSLRPAPPYRRVRFQCAPDLLRVV